MMIQDDQIRNEMLRQVEARGAGGSICPSEVARALVACALAPEWRGLMNRVRAVAASLSRERRIDILRKGKPVEAEAIKGVIRLRLKAQDPGAACGS